MYYKIRPTYKALQWDGTNAEDFEDWLSAHEPDPVSTEVQPNDELWIFKQGSEWPYYMIPLNTYLVSSPHWGAGDPPPYGDLLNPTEFADRYEPVA